MKCSECKFYFYRPPNDGLNKHLLEKAENSRDMDGSFGWAYMSYIATIDYGDSQCRLTPKYENVSGDYWCGQFQAK